MEDSVVEWFDYNYATAQSLLSHIKRPLDVSQFSKQFDIESVEVGGIDFSVWKVKLIAHKVEEEEAKCC